MFVLHCIVEGQLTFRVSKFPSSLVAVGRREGC